MSAGLVAMGAEAMRSEGRSNTGSRILVTHPNFCAMEGTSSYPSRSVGSAAHMVCTRSLTSSSTKWLEGDTSGCKASEIPTRFEGPRQSQPLHGILPSRNRGICSCAGC